MSFPLQRKTTLQTATTIATTSVDPNLRQKYGTSVDEFMSREHQKEIQKKIGELRQQFQVINKDKNGNVIHDLSKKTIPKNLSDLIVRAIYDNRKERAEA